jgi:uncharacterized protein (TIGR00369 family)
MTDAARSRTYTWDDPAPPLAASHGMTGLEFLQAMGRGEFPPPPIAQTMGFELGTVTEGEAVFTVRPQEFHLNPIGAVHGGVVCTLLDSATGCAVHSTLPAGVGYTSIDLQVQYLRGAQPGMGVLTCRGRVVKPGRRVAFAEASVEDAEGRLIATATSSLLIIPLG